MKQLKTAYGKIILYYYVNINSQIKSTEKTHRKRADEHYTLPPLDRARVKEKCQGDW